jgi:hypothetical protein
MWLRPDISVASTMGGAGLMAPPVRLGTEPTAAAVAPAATVNVTTAGAAPAGIFSMFQMHPLQSEIWKNMSKPHFSGRPQDFAKFEAEWEEHEQAIYAAGAGPPTEQAMLMAFKSAVDEATQIKLRSRMAQNPHITLAAFRAELRREFGVDAQKQYRRVWEGTQLPLRGPHGQELNLQDWRQFEAEYRFNRERVPERTDTEERRMLFTKLPPGLQEQLLREQAKRRVNKPWVRLTFPTRVHGPAVLTEIENALRMALPPVRECASGYIIETPTESLRELFLALHGSRYGDDEALLSLNRHEYEMTGNEILDFVTSRLRTAEELAATREAFGVARIPAPARLSEVVAAPQPVEVKPIEKESSQKNTTSPGKKDQRDSRNGKGKKSPEKKRQPSPVKKSSTGTCYACQKANLPSEHDFRQCEVAKKARAKNQGSMPAYGQTKECRLCWREGRPFVHDYRECDHFKKLAKERNHGQPLSPSRPAGPLKARAE